VNKTQQIFDIFRRKPASAFAPHRLRGNPHPSVFHNFSIRNYLDSSSFHLYDFCWKSVPPLSGPVARPKKRLLRTFLIVTIVCVLSRG
jgi:hypothetical protein